jgi:hypothetical protein
MCKAVAEDGASQLGNIISTMTIATLATEGSTPPFSTRIRTDRKCIQDANCIGLEELQLISGLQVLHSE